MEEVVLLESSTLRHQLCTERNTEVLEQIGNLVLIPNIGFATTEMLAEFYQVSIETIKKITLRHKDELELDGYIVVPWKEFMEKYSLPLKSKGRMVALYPRKAILRIGMLLRDSSIAKQVRTYLINAEKALKEICTEDTPLSMMAQQLSQNAQELAAHARMICSIVNEIGRNRDGIKNLENKFQDHDSKFQDHDSRIYHLEMQKQDKEETISKEQAKQLMDKVKKISRPVSFWRKFNSYFQISRYIHLPKSKFGEACRWIEQHIADSEVLWSKNLQI
ncbi:MAG: hypothetical protein HUU50_03830 [Candidatus Brocadiae bacterium]|nr:hypothetical protein [Candidatus Brocadiia bacterium]